MQNIFLDFQDYMHFITVKLSLNAGSTVNIQRIAMKWSQQQIKVQNHFILLFYMKIIFKNVRKKKIKFSVILFYL